ncbi:MAG TPA: endolytic transglycosylase MltG, partial [Ignavibacteriales bacterium]|nr:endolytic transglycosylase MltG [Ignavibacteriales bacterium]
MEKKDKTKISFKELLTKKQFYLIAVFFAAVLALLVYTFFSPNYYKREEPVSFIVPQGASVNFVINELYKNGIIPSKFKMKAAAYLYGAHKNFKAGRYEIPNGLSYLELAELFKKGAPAEEVLVTFQEGITIRDMAGILKHKFGTDSSAFVKLAFDKEFTAKKGLDAVNLEGYMLPDSYYFFEDAT